MQCAEEDLSTHKTMVGHLQDVVMKCKSGLELQLNPEVEIAELKHRIAKLEEGLAHRDEVIAQLAASRKAAFSACRSYADQVTLEAEAKLSRMTQQLQLERKHHSTVYHELLQKYQRSERRNNTWDESSTLPPSPESSELSDDSIDSAAMLCLTVSPPTKLSSPTNGSCSKLPCSFAGDSKKDLELEDLLEIFDGFPDTDDVDYATW